MVIGDELRAHRRHETKPRRTGAGLPPRVELHDARSAVATGARRGRGTESDGLAIELLDEELEEGALASAPTTVDESDE